MRPLRSPLVQAVLAWMFAAWVRLCLASMRWTAENQSVADDIRSADGGVVIAFWHGRLSLAPGGWSAIGNPPVRAVISLSQDGEFIARAMARLGFAAIRGSSAKAGVNKAKGGAGAFRDSLRWVRSGGALAITPDGPRGPAREMAEGTPTLARASGAPGLLLGLACRPAIRLRSWDEAILPLPFARGAMVWDLVRHPDDGASAAALAVAWASRLSAATDRAEALVR